MVSSTLMCDFDCFSGPHLNSNLFLNDLCFSSLVGRHDRGGAKWEWIEQTTNDVYSSRRRYQETIILSLPRTTEVECLTFQRLGQRLFREQLMDYWEKRCPLTGITDEHLLRASHIIPWVRCATAIQQLDPWNGLLLSALWDAAFDRGLVRFNKDGKPIYSDRLSETAHAELSRSHKKNIPLKSKHQANLTWHRDNVFDCDCD